ncbi:hypothetical protein [Clostridium manihotivorum]|uniref:Uncharacterized protein n=1 Tax=Clostridium manihotivorum TaxID=2320868 RepID=A0A3R5UEA7_9CLOT|nr:hypothetical protein [Clostridium manihotivorum]QAA31448.1 hypothetical protein C1I91_07210 [Clostridium manihotivorum]
MNKREKIYSSIIIVMTAISVSILLTYKDNSYDYGDLKIDQQQFQVNNQDGKNALDKGKIENNTINKSSTKLINNNSNSNYKENLNSSQIKHNSSEDITLKEDANDEGKDYIYSDNQVSEEESAEDETVQTMSIFKVDKSTIISKISVADKAKLLYISRKLSSADYSNIEDDLKSSNELEAAEDIFKILKNRLSSQDYDKVKSILDPYINVEYIDGNLCK